jgi:carbamate kinase
LKKYLIFGNFNDILININEIMNDKKELIIVALGGNALLNSKSKGTIEERESAAALTSEQLLPLFQNTMYEVVLTHGNGPQVGNLLIQNDEAADKVPPMPLDVCVAETQGEIGYILQKAMQNTFSKNGLKNITLTLLTQVLVDENDPAFSDLSKPVGPYYSKEQTLEILKTKDWKFKEDPAGKGYRRVVASPRPIKIMQANIISDLVARGYSVIAVGGGGIPVWNSEDNELRGMEAVIDKDLASAQLAIDLKADKLIILTNVECCYINFKKPNQIDLKDLNLDEAQTYYDQGHFSAGSMGPKILAAIEFVQNTGNTAIITSIEKLSQALSGNAGTIIHQ